MKMRNRVFWLLSLVSLAAFSARAMAVGSDVGDVFPNIRFSDAQGYTPPLFHGSRMGIIKTVEGEPFQPLGTPYNLVIDRDGTVRYKWIGNQAGVSAGVVRELL